MLISLYWQDLKAGGQESRPSSQSGMGRWSDHPLNVAQISFTNMNAARILTLIFVQQAPKLKAVEPGDLHPDQSVFSSVQRILRYSTHSISADLVVLTTLDGRLYN